MYDLNVHSVWNFMLNSTSHAALVWLPNRWHFPLTIKIRLTLNIPSTSSHCPAFCDEINGLINSSGWTRNIVNLQSYLRMKHCVIQMENKDELRCVRAIVVAKTKRDDNPQSMVSRLRTHIPHLAHELLKCVVSLVFVVSRRSRSSRLSSRNTSSTWSSRNIWTP